MLVGETGSFRQGKWKRRVRRHLGDTLNLLDGAEHRERRILLQPSLDRRRIAAYAPAVVARAERLDRDWREGQPLDLRRELNRLSLTIAGEVLLTSDLDQDADELCDAALVVISASPRLAGGLPGTRSWRALRMLRAQASAIVARRRAEGGEHGDLVDALRGLPDAAAVDEVVAFLLAAIDEPPGALASAFYLLGRHPAVEAALHAELDAAGDELPYLEAVLWEALRLAPPVRYIDRCPVAETRIAGHAVAAGADVLVSPLVTHRDERFFPRASSFEPERWLRDELESRPRFSYLPFGAGPRTCIGEPLAWLTMTVGLATIASRWRLHLDPRAACPDPRKPALVVTPERR